jgi:hypothetical protein
MRVVRIARRDGDGKKHKHREDCARYFSVGVFRECGMLQTAVCNFALLLFPFFFFFFFFGKERERKWKLMGLLLLFIETALRREEGFARLID